MKLKLRLISFLLVFVLAAGNIAQVNVYADERETSEKRQTSEKGAVKELTDLEITDLSEPVAGMPLDSRATVRSAEGVTWEIPVVWIGEDGKAATVAKSGKKYVPNFAFYVPKGYKVKGAGADGRFKIRLPKFLESLGLDQLLFVADATNNITYITWNPAIITGIYVQTYSEPATGENHSTNSDYGDEDSDDAGDGAPGAPGEEDKPPFWEVSVHCTQNVIANVGYEVLARLVSLIKNEIEPRAIAALTEGFYVFAEAADRGELGTSIGLYIYDARFDPKEDKRNIGDGVDAYVWGEYDPQGFKYYMGVNTEHLLVVNDSGIYELNEDGLTEAKNIITHELMHALMYDYTRTGLASEDNAESDPEQPGQDPSKQWNAFPKWFVEGTASTVHHVYRYQRYSFAIMSDAGRQSREAGDPLYTQQSVARAFAEQDPDYSTNIRLYRTDFSNDVGGAYAGGYLAVSYLATLVANNGVVSDADTDTIRYGLNKILRSLHDGIPFDTIIRNTGKYTGIIDFEKKFATDSDPSLDFCVGFLNRMDELTPGDDFYLEDGYLKCRTLANGSILLPYDTQKNDPLEERTETSNGQGILKIADTSDHVYSDVDEDTAKSTAGSYHTWDDAVDSAPSQAEAVAAAESMPEVTEPVVEPAEEQATEPVIEEPAPEPVIMEPAPEPAVDPAEEAAPEPVIAEPAAEAAPEPDATEEPSSDYEEPDSSGEGSESESE